MKNIFTKIFTIIMFLPTAVYAAGDPPQLDDGTLGDMVNNILQYLFPIAGLISVVFIIVGGYMWMVSGGDPARVQKAQGTLTWALIGLGFVLLSIAMLQIVTRFIGA